MGTVKISDFILVIALPVSAIFAFVLVGCMKFLCQTLKIHFRKPYAIGELKFRLLTSMGESVLMALIINVGGIIAQAILTPSVIWRQWLWSTILTWILWGLGTYLGKSMAVRVFGENICSNVVG